MKPVWIITSICVHALGAFLVVGTLLPFLPVGAWLVRGWDFPRVHIAVACLVVIALLALLALFRGWRIDIPITVACLIAAFCWQGYRIAPYTPLWPRTVASASQRDGGVRLLVVNLQVENGRHAEVAAMIRDAEPDVLLLIEIDSAWAEGLAGVRHHFEHHTDETRPDGLGMALWSRLALGEVEVREIITQRRPSIHARLTTEDGRTTRFIGVHPTPPGLRKDHDGDDQQGRYDSRIRDAELMVIAEEIADASDDEWIVAGDFNDVAWSNTTRLFQELSGLEDPRIGRGFYNTYNAQHPFLRYPVDHVFVSPGFSVAGMRRLVIPGSDHFAILADLVLDSPQDQQSDAGGEDHDEARELIREGEEDARENGESSP